MVQMTIADQTVIKAIAGNDKCADCGMKNPQWASVSFGTIFCLECSGIHRSLGVHITFVRSVAMDSWTDQQLAIMRKGGNANCASYLSQNGILPATPIKQKYESSPAQLYKEILKARVAGLPEPTSLPAPAPRSTGSVRSTGSAGSDRGDPNGMEQLKGESEQQYVARQTKLRADAKARMAAKFGGGGMGSSMGGGGRMAGVGSDSSYNPNTGYGAGAGMNLDVDSVVSGIGSAFATLGSYGQQGVNTISTYANDPNLKDNVNRSYSSGIATGASLWSSLTTSVSQVAAAIAEPDADGDGLADFQRRMHEERENRSATGSSRYSGFGSEDVMSGKVSSTMGASKVVQSSQESHQDMMSFNQWGNEDTFATAPATNTAPPQQEQQPSINNIIDRGSTDPPVDASKMKAEGTGDDFFSNFGA